MGAGDVHQLIADCRQLGDLIAVLVGGLYVGQGHGTAPLPLPQHNLPVPHMGAPRPVPALDPVQERRRAKRFVYVLLNFLGDGQGGSLHLVLPLQNLLDMAVVPVDGKPQLGI